jgi:membrane protease YdiL (CAAX protease family)
MDWFSHSHLFELARRGKRLTNILVVIPIAFLIIMFFGQLGVIPVIFIMTLLYGPPTGITTLWDFPSPLLSGFWAAVILVSSFFLVYVIVGLWVGLFEKRPFWTLGYEGKNALQQYLRGLLIGMLIFSAAVGILSAFRFVGFENSDPSQRGLAALSGVIFILIGWIVQGGAEEMLARGWILPVLGARYRPWIGLVVSALSFSAWHALNEHLSVIAVINLALFGIFAGLYAMREGSIWGISALHSAWNWVQGNFFGFAVSGSSFGGGTLLDLVEKGPDWMTGGLFGPEGGFAVTLVLLIGIGVILLWKSKPKR